MSSDEKSAPPPYSPNANSSHNLHSNTHNPYGSSRESAASDLTRTRIVHLQSIIDSCLLRIISHRTSIGLSRTAVALLPKNSSSAISPFCDTSLSSPDEFPSEVPQILGVASSLDNIDYYSDPDVAEKIQDEHEMVQIQLSDPMDTFRFWSQKAVRADLKRLLEETLVRSTSAVANPLRDDPPTYSYTNEKQQPSNSDMLSPQYREYQASTISPSLSIKSPNLPSRPDRASRRGLLSRLSSRSTNTMEVNETGRRHVEAQQKLQQGVNVNVDLEEICLRTLNSFGLYETITQEAVVVTVYMRT